MCSATQPFAHERVVVDEHDAVAATQFGGDGGTVGRQQQLAGVGEEVVEGAHLAGATTGPHLVDARAHEFGEIVDGGGACGCVVADARRRIDVLQTGGRQ